MILLAYNLFPHLSASRRSHILARKHAHIYEGNRCFECFPSTYSTYTFSNFCCNGNITVSYFRSLIRWLLLSMFFFFLAYYRKLTQRNSTLCWWHLAWFHPFIRSLCLLCFVSIELNRLLLLSRIHINVQRLSVCNANGATSYLCCCWSHCFYDGSSS